MIQCKNKFWIENPSELFCAAELLPLSGMTLEAKMNALIRLCFLFMMFLLIVAPKQKWGWVLLILFFLFINIFYYVQKKRMKEHFQFPPPRYLAHPQPQPKAQVTYFNINAPPSNLANVPQGSLKLDTPQQYRFCLDWQPLEEGPKYWSRNQNLAGGPIPRTKIKPVIVPPIAALDYWRANPLVTHSHINKETQDDVYQSGYVVSSCCGTGDKILVANTKDDKKEQYSNIIEDYHPPNRRRRGSSSGSSTNTNTSGDIIENYEHPYRATQKVTCPKIENLYPSTSGDVLTKCGYNPDQVCKSNLPSNFAAGNCEQDPSMKDYNKNVFTQIINPGVYTQSQIIEPISSNIGISYTQQFPPTTCNMDKDW